MQTLCIDSLAQIVIALNVNHSILHHAIRIGYMIWYPLFKEKVYNNNVSLVAYLVLTHILLHLNNVVSFYNTHNKPGI